MYSQFEVKEHASQPVLSVRTKTSVQELPQVFTKVFGMLYHYLGEIGEQPAGMPFGAYFNMDMQNLDMEIGVPVSRRLPEKGEIKPSQIPAGKYATAMYTGPYEEMVSVYAKLTEDIATSGNEPSGVVYEFYYNSPAEVSPQDLKTEIMFALK